MGPTEKDSNQPVTLLGPTSFNLYSIITLLTPLKYVFENIIENGAFAPKGANALFSIEQMLYFP